MSDPNADSKRRHVFISHHHKNDAEVDKLTKLLSRKGYDIRNSSIRAKPANRERLEKGLVKDEVIRRLLKMKMSWAGTVIVLVGKDTHTRPWVNWEIEQAAKMGKRIVGVWAQGAQECDLPENLIKYRDAMVGWNSENIVDAIDGSDNTSHLPGGGQFPMQQIGRATC
ncbi:MAG: TIR domain-containing protein [Pirellulaceae bacterium]|nr:TIR domain-containing protein [Pirellulaceae bacterium]